MRRKLIKLGGSTCINIPSYMLEQLGLKTGHEVNICFDFENKIIIISKLNDVEFIGAEVQF